MNSTTITRTVLDSKAILARLMATENITVEHVPTAQTAYFDTESRRLVFPCWKGMSNDLYDMLAGHETAHALFTPAGAQVLVDAIRKVDTRNGSSAAKTFLNIVEDARIERLMKARLPGLRRSFFNAYKELMEHPLFVDMFPQVAEMRFIDRINMQFKWGAWLKVPFTAEELPLVKAVEETKTFDDVIEVAHRIWEMQRGQENAEPQDQQQDQGGEGDAGEQGEGQDNPQGSSSTREPNKNADAGESKSEQKQQDAKGQEQTKGKGDQSKAQSASSEGQDAAGNEASETQSNTQKTDREPTAAATDSIMQTASNGFRDGKAQYYMPITMPSFNTKIGIIDFRTKVLPILEKFNTLNGGADLLAKWEATSRRDVSIMQQEFLRRMAADASARTNVSDTGSIDVNRLWSYKISDDIFLQNTTVRNGQSHGIVIFVDFSGSMSGIMMETIRQMLMLAAWCRRSNIPCDVYGFSDAVGTEWTGKDQHGYPLSPWIHRDQDGSRVDLDQGMRLVHIVSTKGLSERDWRSTAGGLMAAFNSRNAYYTPNTSAWSSEKEYRHACRLFSLNSTPTVAATAAALTVVEDFKRRNSLQIVHFVTLTDGQPSDRIGAIGKPTGKKTSWGAEELADPVTSHGNGWGRTGYELLDPVTGLRVRTTGSRDVAALNELLCKRIPGLNSVGISITPKREFKSLLRWSGLTEEQQTKCMEQSKRDGFLTAAGVHGHTVWFAVPNPRLDETDPFDTLTVNANKTALTKAFAASLEKAGNNRLLCTRLVELMAKPAKVTR
jgi:hypothetical protein